MNTLGQIFVHRGSTAANGLAKVSLYRPATATARRNVRRDDMIILQVRSFAGQKMQSDSGEGILAAQVAAEDGHGRREKAIWCKALHDNVIMGCA